MIEGGLLLALFVLTLLVGIPIVAGLSIVAFLGVSIVSGVDPVVLAQRVTAQVSSPVLVAIPLFLLMGNLMNAGGISKRLFNLAGAFFGHRRGGLAHVNVATSLFMGGLSGSSSADTAVTTRVLVPEMVANGYRPAFAGAVTAASSTMSIILPPSVAMIIYAALSDASVGRLFVGGLLPGVVLAFLFFGTVYWLTRGPDAQPERDKPSAQETLACIGSALPGLALPIIIIGGIRFGFFTATEAAAVGCLYAAFLGAAIYRDLKIKHVGEVLLETASMTGVVMLIVGAAAPLSWYLGVERIPQTLADSISDFASPLGFMMATVALVAVAGMLLEATALLILVTPLLAPVAGTMGIDPIHYGLLVILTIILGNISPPMGQMVYIASGVGKIPAEQIFKEVISFLPPIIFAIILVMAFPEPIMWFVRVFGP